MVDDSADDAELMRRALTRGGVENHGSRVETQEQFLAALSPLPDVILADFNVPGFGALPALHLLRARDLDVPLIMVTGTIDDQAAAQCMKEGAADYVLKDRLGRLGPAVESALRHARLQRERRQMAQALSASEEKYRLVFQEGPFPAWIVDGESLHFLEVNQKAIERYGYTREEFRALTLRDIRPPEDLPAVLEGIQAVLAGAVRTSERRHMTKAGELRTVSVASHPIEFDGRRCLLAVVDDITERKRLESQLRHAQRMEAVGQLAGGLAHDFNNLLSVILSYAQLAAGRSPGDPDLERDIEEIRKAGERGAHLTRQLLAFSRSQVLQPRVVPVNSIVADIEGMLRRLIGEDVELTLRLGSLDGHVRVDPNQIEQVIMNLAVNARDAMPNGGRLVLETADAELDYAEEDGGAAAGAHVAIVVRDSGAGMEDATRSRIFEPFFTTKERGKGTGLGLSTAYGIVRQSGGHIEVRTAPGEGSTFSIYLPRLDRPPLDPVAVTEGGTAKIGRGSETVMILEDEPSLRSLLRCILESNDYEVLEPPDPEAAVLVAQQHDGPIHLLISDVIMPGTTGPAIAAQIAASRPELRVLFVSGYAADVLGRQHLDGNVRFLQKPFTPTSLLQAVRQVLDE